jgi:hypothetical protein
VANALPNGKCGGMGDRGRAIRPKTKPRLRAGMLKCLQVMYSWVWAGCRGVCGLKKAPRRDKQLKTGAKGSSK